MARRGALHSFTAEMTSESYNSEIRAAANERNSANSMKRKNALSELTNEQRNYLESY